MQQVTTAKANEQITIGTSRSTRIIEPRCDGGWSWQMVCLTHPHDGVGQSAEDMQGHVDMFAKEAKHKFAVHCSGHGFEAVPTK